MLDTDYVTTYFQEHYGIGEENFSGDKCSYFGMLKETFQSLTGFSIVQGEGVIAVVEVGSFHAPLHLTESYDFSGIESIHEYTMSMNHCIQSYNDLIVECELLPWAMESIPDNDPRIRIVQRFRENMQTLSFNKKPISREDVSDEMAENMILLYDLLGELHKEIGVQKRLEEMNKRKSQHESKELEL